MSVYGVTVASDGNNNISIGKFSPDQRASFRERIDHTGNITIVRAYVKTGVGYSLGTGGSTILDIQSDDGTSNHRPSGTVLATKTLVTPNVGTGNVGVWTLTSPLTVTGGQLVHFVFRSGDAAPVTNFVSINGLELNSSPTPLEPGSSDIDRAVLIGTSASLSTYTLDRTYYPILDIEFADGYHGGQGYYEATSLLGQKPIAGLNMARQNITPTAARTVTSVSLYGYRQSGTTQDMLVRVKNSVGTVLSSVTIPLADFNIGNTGSGYGSRWVTGTLDAPTALSIGQQYFLELSAPGEVNPYIVFPEQGKGGSTFGLAFLAGNVFTDGYLESSSNGGSSWVVHSASTAWRLQAYFTEADPNPYVPPFIPKAWMDYATGGTPITAAALIDLETRLASYTDSAALGSGVVVTRGESPPVSGEWAVGSVCFNSAPTAGGVALWMCITAGTPGVWIPALVSSGATYYVDPAGSDSNTGLTTSQAWATIAQVNAASFSAGDSVLFKRGGTWRGTQLVFSESVTMGAYGASGNDPIISGGALLTSWSVFSGSTYRAAVTATANYVLAGQTPLTLGSGTGSLTAGQFFYSAGFVYVHLGGTNPSTLQVEASQLARVAYVNTLDSVTIQDIEFQFSTNQALWLEAATNTIIERCTFRYHCYTSNSGVVLIQNGSNARITDCVFDNLQNDGIWVHNNPNVEIGYCDFTRIGALVGDVQSDAIQFENTFNTAPNSDGGWIHHNTVSLGANTPKGCILVNIDSTIPGASSSALVEWNVCDGGNYGIAPHASNVTVRNNICSNQTSTFGGGIHIDSAVNPITNIVIAYNLVYGSTRDGIVIQDTSFSRQVLIAHNTIVDSGRVQCYLGSPVYGLVENNIFWNTGAAPSLRTLYILSVTPAQTLTVNYNLFQTAFSNYLRLGGSEYSTLAAWRAATGYDANTISSDPLFTNASTNTYTLQAASPAINAGGFVAGITGPVSGSAPDIGFAETA